MNIPLWICIAIVFACARRPFRNDVHDVRDAVQIESEGPSRTLYDDTDLLEIAIRSSDAVVQNLDAVSLAALALSSFPVAFLVFVAERIGDLPPVVLTVVLSLDGLAIVFGYLGYEWGYRFSKERILDSVDGATLVAAYAAFGDVVVGEAIASVSRVAERHRRIRSEKRRCVSLAMGCFGLALITFVSWATLGKARIAPAQSLICTRGTDHSGPPSLLALGCTRW